MRARVMTALAVMHAVASPTAHAAPADIGPLTLFPGTYTNEEDVYFATEAKKPPPAYVAMTVTREGAALRLREIDKFGKPLEDGHVMTVSGDTITVGRCIMPYRREGAALVALPRGGTCHDPSVLSRITAAGIAVTLPGGAMTMLRRARGFTCWGAALKATKKADGSDDWYGAYTLKLHDQGGRAAFGGGDTGAPPLVLRMRNVVWPSGPNKPSLVLYVHKPEDPDHAVSYSWADPGARRIGINLRWMQASCTLDTVSGG